ncbi:MAG: SPOR domain-containing protein [Brevinematales bacterium]|nr:SPOR domain-containing protein [Brevinematales bacterium]
MKSLLRNLVFGAVGTVALGATLVLAVPQILKIIPNMINRAVEEKIEPANDEKPWSLSLATFRNEEDAQISVERLRQLKLPAYYVPRLTANNNVWFDVHVGSYTNIEDANALKSNLNVVYPKLPVTVDHYSNYVSNYMDYQNEKATNENALKRFEVAKKPSSAVSTNMLLTLYQFPVDKRYSIVELIMGESSKYNKLYPYAGFLIKSKYFPSSDIFWYLLGNSYAYSYFICEDKLFKERIGVLVFEPKETNLYTSLQEKYESQLGEKLTNVAYKIHKDIVQGAIYQSFTKESNAIYTFVGENTSSHHIITLKTYDLNLSNFLVLFSDQYKNKELLVYPEMMRGLAILPENTGFTLQMFDFYVLPWGYAKEKNNAWWARSMVGHWTYEVIYGNTSGDFIKISLFDLLYRKKAEQIHKNFRKEKEEVSAIMKVFYGIENFPVNFGNIKGWYMDKTDNNNEISFGFGSFVVAVNSFSPYKLPFSDLRSIAEKLIYKNETQTNSETPQAQ